MEEGDADGAVVWRRILEAIVELSGSPKNWSELQNSDRLIHAARELLLALKWALAHEHSRHGEGDVYPGWVTRRGGGEAHRGI
jgi:hypothetical protein